MDRRTAAGALLATWFLAACGGGGADGTGTELDLPGLALSGNGGIALWGDSHVAGLPGNDAVPGVAAELLGIIAGREVFAGGGPGLTSTQLADRQVQDTLHDTWVNVFWYGGNNQADGAQIKADLARSIDSLAEGNDRFVVLPVLNQASPQERRGGDLYDDILQLNAELAALYPNNFLDIRSYLVSLFNPSSAQDVADNRDDVPPTSLRADGVHLNELGALAVARRLLEFIVDKGW